MGPDSSRQRRHATLADVAEQAGVSPSTASRSLGGSSAVSEATRQRVRAAAAALNYEPNHLARSLRLRSSRLIGVVVPDISIPYFARIVKGAQSTLERAGFNVLVVSTDRQPEREAIAIRTLREHRTDGILVADTGGFEQPSGIPVVFFDNLVKGVGVAHVASANAEGIKLLVDHLMGHGHRRIGYVGGPPGLTSGIERLAGFQEAVRAAGRSAELVALGDEFWSVESGREAMHTLLRAQRPPTAVVAASDTLAAGAILAARDMKRRVPEDVAIVSFDDPSHGELFEPALTALARNERQIGELAATLLLHALQSGAYGPPTEVRLPVELIIRRSCGCSVREGLIEIG